MDSRYAPSATGILFEDMTSEFLSVLLLSHSLRCHSLQRSPMDSRFTPSAAGIPSNGLADFNEVCQKKNLLNINRRFIVR